MPLSRSLRGSLSTENERRTRRDHSGRFLHADDGLFALGSPLDCGGSAPRESYSLDSPPSKDCAN